MKAEQFEELKLTGSLPSPTGVGLTILQVTQNDDYSIDDVVRPLEADPTLTGRILKLANSAKASGTEPATTAREAAIRLGAREVRNVSLGFTLVSGNRTGNCRAFEYQGFWNHSVGVAVAATVLAERTGGLLPGEAFTCGLLSGIGRLALASIHPDAYAKVLHLARNQSSARLAELEREHLGADNRELTAAMLRDWNLPEAFAFAVEAAMTDVALDEVADDMKRNATRVLRWARDLSRAMTLSKNAPIASYRLRRDELEALRERLELDDASFLRLWDEVRSGWMEWGQIMGVSPKLGPSLQEICKRAELDPAGEEVDAEPAVQPAAEDTAGEPARSPRANRSGSGMRLLVVENDPAALRVLSVYLERDGHTVMPASNGREALQVALEKRPQVVVTDWAMPEMDGLEMVRALRRSDEGQRMQVILLTEKSEEQRVIEAFDAGIDEFINRPFNPRILLARVRAAQRVVELREQVERDARTRAQQLAKNLVLTRQLRAIARTDQLTELPNRRHAMDRLEQEVSRCAREGSSMSVIGIDIDKFKSVNDTYGHDVGDVVLKRTGQKLRSCLRRGDIVCRMGGEEFLVLCPDSSLGEARITAERLRSEVEANVIQFGEFDRAVTLSLGVAELHGSDPNLEALLKRADRGVYAAKEGGRNRVVAIEDDADVQEEAA